MGVIHKLKPELIEFILEQKKADKNLSCRKIAALVYAQFKLKLSKSSVNSILKQTGLSLPIGRRSKPELKKTPPGESAAMPVRCIKAILLDGSSFYLDGQLHTVWHSAAQIPEAFSAPIHNIKSYTETKGGALRREPSPFVLFFASGYDSPTEELFEFILSFYSPEKRISQLIFYDNGLRELKKINAFAGEGSPKEPFPFSRHFAFGVWPWQFKEYIKVRLATEFLPFEGGLVRESPQKEPAPATGRNFYIAEEEVELTSPKKQDRVVKLRGAALKTEQKEKKTLLADSRPFAILSNFTTQEMPLSELAALYLNRWLNLEETLQDFSRKIEQFRNKRIN